MIELAAIYCSAILTTGSHSLECTAEYLHTTASGERYVSTVAQNMFAAGGEKARCTGEGFPVRVTLKEAGGGVICQNELALFESGFESGDTGEWTNANP